MTYHQQKYDRIRNRMITNQQMLIMADNFADIIERADAEGEMEMTIYPQRSHREAKIQVCAQLRSAEAVEAIGRILTHENVEKESFYDENDHPVLWAVWTSDR